LLDVMMIHMYLQALSSENVCVYVGVGVYVGVCGGGGDIQS